MIERNEVDIAVGSFYANTERAQVSDFSPILEITEYIKEDFQMLCIIFFLTGTNFL